MTKYIQLEQDRPGGPELTQTAFSLVDAAREMDRIIALLDEAGVEGVSPSDRVSNLLIDLRTTTEAWERSLESRRVALEPPTWTEEDDRRATALADYFSARARLTSDPVLANWVTAMFNSDWPAATDYEWLVTAPAKEILRAFQAHVREYDDGDR